MGTYINLYHPCTNADTWVVESEADKSVALKQGYIPLDELRAAVLLMDAIKKDNPILAVTVRNTQGKHYSLSFSNHKWVINASDTHEFNEEDAIEAVAFFMSMASSSEKKQDGVYFSCPKCSGDRFKVSRTFPNVIRYTCCDCGQIVSYPIWSSK